MRERLAVGPVTLRARAVAAPPGAIVALAPEALQIAQRIVAHEHHLAAVSAVSAVGTAARHVRFPAEAHAAVAAGARLDVDPRAIVEHPPIVTAAPLRDRRGRQESPANPQTARSTDVSQPRIARGPRPRHVDYRRLPGLGAATARRACADGWRVVLAARSRELLDALAEELGSPQRALAVTCDVTDWEDQQADGAGSAVGVRADRRRFRQCRLRRARGFLEDTPEHWREMV